MALTVINGRAGAGGGGILYRSPGQPPHSAALLRRHVIIPYSPRTLHIASAKKLSSRTGKFDSRNRRTSTATEDEEKEEDQLPEASNIERTGPENSALESAASSRVEGSDGFVLPELPGDKPDFWEGPQWDALGFFVQYLWAFGIAFALIACGIAVATYNEGATDFKETPAYKESIKSQELLEEPNSGSDVFESNPTEVAPSLE
ncbi:uncharacterized protein LOC116214879 [Punica granatum]|uniref:Uncharacterized protein n=2 Tax=Punica granatum TaxID=22663 RepID=A0A218VXK5_PUNGR|nr:uncharacterized protein LOC116214879 [Punica granatum]OWM65146.1 hypothetical protein CDL15_Pgr008733 [Punica granatum]PKI43867.1 hypothetical protein CRG98_035701 [Punica granatum]